MPRYLIQASYTPATRAIFINKPQDRVAPMRALAERLGGSLQTLDFCLGEYDVVATMRLPDDATAAAAALVLTSAGHLSAYRTTRLMSAEEFVSAQQKAQGVGFEPPGTD